MPELRFYTGPMSSGKSTLALQTAFNLKQFSEVLLITMMDRSGDQVTSRIGISAPAVIIEDDTDLFSLIEAQDEWPDVVICDEAQFYSPEQVEQLARAVDLLRVDVYAYGLLVDFQSKLFPGTARFLELADKRLELQVETRCWCGDPATQNARLVGGVIVLEGDQVVVGDTDGAEVSYQLLCRRHFMSAKVRE